MTKTRPDERRWFLWALKRYGLLIARAVYRIFAALGRHLLAGLEKVASWMFVREAMRLTDPVVWLPGLREAIRRPIWLALRAGAEDERVRHAKGSPQRIVDAIRARVRSLRDLIVGSAIWGMALASLRSAIINAVRVGSVLGNPTARVAALFERRRLYVRSARIGHSEGHGAIEGGKDESRLELFREGYLNAKRWRTREDERVRDSHEHADGQTVRVDQDFIVGGERARYPGDSRLSPAQRCNCRCYTVGVKV